MSESNMERGDSFIHYGQNSNSDSGTTQDKKSYTHKYRFFFTLICLLFFSLLD